MAHNAQELQGIPGVRKAVADTGASSWCTSDKDSILPGTYQKFDRPIKLGGIAGGLHVIWQRSEENGDGVNKRKDFDQGL